MKMLFAVIQNDDEKALLGRLMKNGFRATRIASSGGFLRSGNSTLMIGVEDDKVESALDIIRECCKSRNITMPSYPYMMEGGAQAVYPINTRVGGATVFIMPVERKETM